MNPFERLSPKLVLFKIAYLFGRFDFIKQANINLTLFFNDCPCLWISQRWSNRIKLVHLSEVKVEYTLCITKDPSRLVRVQTRINLNKRKNENGNKDRLTLEPPSVMIGGHFWSIIFKHMILASSRCWWLTADDSFATWWPNLDYRHFYLLIRSVGDKKRPNR